jgi:hypothetical protein
VKIALTYRHDVVVCGHIRRYETNRIRQELRRFWSE